MGLRSKIINLLKKEEIIFKDTTNKQDVINLITKLRPVKTQKPLIRLGSDGDGGYLLPDDLDLIEACFSPGVHQISDFELDCLKKGIKIFLADKSIDKPNLDVPDNQYNFIKKFVGSTNNNDFTTIDNWVNSSSISSDSDLILQMDIESWEYASLLNLSDNLQKRFRIIIIEFHDLDKLWVPIFHNIASATFDKILQTHKCVHIHPNNNENISVYKNIEIPKVAEFTFIRKDRDILNSYKSEFPDKLDVDNSATKPHIRLPKIWHN